MAERTHTIAERPAFSVMAGAPNIVLVLIEIDGARWSPSAREWRALQSLAETGVELACVWDSNAPSECGENGEPATVQPARHAALVPFDEPALPVANAASALPGEPAPSAPRTVPTGPFPHAIDLASSHPSPTAQLVALCRELGIAPHQVALIATTPASNDIALKVGTLLALKGSGYQNEAAADRVFAPRHAGGLADALEYVRRLIAASRTQRMR